MCGVIELLGIWRLSCPPTSAGTQNVFGKRCRWHPCWLSGQSTIAIVKVLVGVVGVFAGAALDLIAGNLGKCQTEVLCLGERV